VKTNRRWRRRTVSAASREHGGGHGGSRNPAMDVMWAGHRVDIARPRHWDEGGRRPGLRGMASTARRCAVVEEGNPSGRGGNEMGSRRKKPIRPYITLMGWWAHERLLVGCRTAGLASISPASRLRAAEQGAYLFHFRPYSSLPGSLTTSTWTPPVRNYKYTMAYVILRMNCGWRPRRRGTNNEFARDYQLDQSVI
jgi:hypothetical protein